MPSTKSTDWWNRAQDAASRMRIGWTVQMDSNGNLWWVARGCDSPQFATLEELAEWTLIKSQID